MMEVGFLPPEETRNVKGANAKLRALPAHVPAPGTGSWPLDALRSLVQTPFQEL